jgi:serine/threonine protein kinase
MTASRKHLNTREWDRLRTLFLHASRLTAAQRQAFVEEQTVEQPAVREQLLAMLAMPTPQADSPLSRAVGSALVDVIEDQRRAMLGKVLGSYRLTSVLGQGGTGTVYLAERADRQYSAEVALKIVDSTSLQVGVGARFRAERQILANLNHPNIARLLDAGETESGQPFLVMEYVRGEPLDQYCDTRRLDLRARLQLFIQICTAVQYAHQNLIVHRDLKPANIIVSEDGTPKLLDFGIAKLLHTEEQQAGAALTRVADRLLTPEYASPEQILGGNVTTASDVYSLGVVLYELVCGLRPYRVPASHSQLELERSICLSDPERPSSNLVRAIASAELPVAEIALARCTSVDRLPRLLSGDIDAIVMRALRKEPQHRYSSVEHLIEDLRRFLNNEPVHARQGNWVYHTRRFAQRHTAGVLAGLGFLAFVVGVAIVMSVQRQQIASALAKATRDGQRAETVSEFMLNVFSAADPYIHFGKEPTARALLEQAAERIQSDLSHEPEVRARLLEAIGVSYLRMGQSERAVTYLDEAIKIQRNLGLSDAKLGPTLASLAVAQREAARYEESDRTLAEALDVARRVSEAPSEQYATLLADLSRLEMLRGNVSVARQHIESAYLVMKDLRGSNDPKLGAILVDLSNVLVWANDLADAERHAREAVRVYSRLPDTHPDRIYAEANLARVLMYLDRLSEAGPLLERVLAAQRFVYGNANNDVADTLGNLAHLHIAKGEYDAAERVLREALEIHEAAGSTVTVKVGFLRTVLGSVLIKKRNYEDSEHLLRDTLEMFSASLPADHQYVASAEYYLGEALLGQRRLHDAEAVLTASMNRWKRTDAPLWRVSRSRSALGEVLFRQGRITEAADHLVSSFKELALDEGADREAKQLSRARVEDFFSARGQTDKLAALLRDVDGRGAKSN